jgi:hypothetical protein
MSAARECLVGGQRCRTGDKFLRPYPSRQDAFGNPALTVRIGDGKIRIDASRSLPRGRRRRMERTGANIFQARPASLALRHLLQKPGLPLMATGIAQRL